MPPGHRRLGNGRVVTDELAAQVIPPPRMGLQSREERASVPALADLQAVSCACARGEVERLREELAEVRAALAQEREAHALAEHTSHLLAQVLAARPAEVSVTPSVTQSVRDASRTTVTESVTKRDAVTVEGEEGRIQQQ
ncbi:hypothetical protein QEG98_28410 [Myxococcus sp. MxC21-1]|uniref:hypothetical protein n=1 Tax=Myxococcus sp. MxC21-1 TaxID=3041439 RepID=UPI002930E29A|nr:hypothetical protein [Myxococcus sp. MxC21-1]WNZ59930.1 hypothetical protein QEG98_28410 [Myxococcus sp. MxC21-1]